METNFEAELEGVLTIKQDGHLLAVVFNDMKRKSQVFYTCKEMGAEDIKNLMQLLITK